MALVSSRALKSHVLICMSHHSDCPAPFALGGGAQKRILQNVCQCEPCWRLPLGVVLSLSEHVLRVCGMHSDQSLHMCLNPAALRTAFHVGDPDKPVSRHGSVSLCCSKTEHEAILHPFSPLSLHSPGPSLWRSLRLILSAQSSVAAGPETGVCFTFEMHPHLGLTHLS